MDAESALSEILDYAQQLYTNARGSDEKCTGANCGTCTQGRISHHILLIADRAGVRKMVNPNDN